MYLRKLPDIIYFHIFNCTKLKILFLGSDSIFKFPLFLHIHKHSTRGENIVYTVILFKLCSFYYLVLYSIFAVLVVFVCSLQIIQIRLQQGSELLSVQS